MERTIDDTLAYVLLLTRHIKKDNVSAAILAVLMNLRFQAHTDGFGYLRKSILLKCRNSDWRLSVIYREVLHILREEIGTNQIDQAIRGTIQRAWKNRNQEKWGYFFPENSKRPSNYEFIAQIACIMELWEGSKEESYAEE